MKTNYAGLIVVCAVCQSVAWADCTTIYAVADTRMLSATPNTNYQTDILSTYNAVGNTQHSVLQFELSGLPSGSVIESATLRLYGKSFFGSTSETEIWVFRNETEWVETQATWNNAATGIPWAHGGGGDFVGTNGEYLVDPYGTWIGEQPGLIPDWFEIEVTDLIVEHHTDVYPNFGIGLAGPLNNQLTFTASEGGADDVIPALIVEYTGNEPPCDGDANDDDVVDPLDAGYVLSRFGCAVGDCNPDCDAADQNGDGNVDPLDVGFVLARFGECS